MKKDNSKSKLSQERIYRLFELTKQKPEMSKRYITLAKTIGEKTNTTIPKELQNLICKKCYSLNITTKKEKDFVKIKCNDCGKERTSKP